MEALTHLKCKRALYRPMYSISSLASDELPTFSGETEQRRYCENGGSFELCGG